MLDLDLLLVPRSLVPAAQSLIRAQEAPESIEKPLYASEEEEPVPPGNGRDEL